jgi:hypothetical protein
MVTLFQFRKFGGRKNPVIWAATVDCPATNSLSLSIFLHYTSLYNYRLDLNCHCNWVIERRYFDTLYLTTLNTPRLSCRIPRDSSRTFLRSWSSFLPSRLSTPAFQVAAVTTFFKRVRRRWSTWELTLYNRHSSSASS